MVAKLTRVAVFLLRTGRQYPEFHGRSCFSAQLCNFLVVIEFDWAEFIWILVRLPVAVWLIATAFIGCDQHALSFAERIVRATLAVVMLIVDPTSQIAGFVLGIGIIALHRIRAHRKIAASS